VPERLLDDEPSSLGKSGRREAVRDGLEQCWRYGQVVHRERLLADQFPQHLRRLVERRLVPVVAGNRVDPFE
jgi:hypothetical protein